MNINFNANLKYPWERVLQQAGYHQHGEGFVKRLGRDYYPRFHLYLQNQNEQTLKFNLHLDQRAGVQVGAAAHANQKDGPQVEQEAERLQQIFDQHTNHSSQNTGI